MSCFLFDTFLFSVYIAVLDRHPDNAVTSIFLTLLMFFQEVLLKLLVPTYVYLTDIACLTVIQLWRN